MAPFLRDVSVWMLLGSITARGHLPALERWLVRGGLPGAVLGRRKLHATGMLRVLDALMG